VVRQSDFFGETITFVNRLDGRAIRSRRLDVDDGMRKEGGGDDGGIGNIDSQH
jgi:hypothetical protein